MEEKVYAQLGESVFTTRLKNGLTILVNRRKDFKKQFAFFATRYGGMNMRFETAEGWQDTPAGVAHFLEHKLFDTKDGNALQIMAANGADPNAFTSFGITGYFFQCTKGFEENLRILLGFVSEPYFTPESVAKEQGIIGQEIAMGDDDAENEVFYDLLNCLYFHHPIRTHIAGTAASIAEITDQTLYTCHRAFYNPANMVLTVVGDVDPEDVARIAEEIVTAEALPAPRTDYGVQEPETVVKPYSERVMAVSAPLFQVGFKIQPPQEGPELLKTQMIGTLAGDLLMGESSPLYTRLYDAGLVNRAFSYGYENFARCAFFALGGESKDPKAVQRVVLEEAKRVAREGLDEAEFQRAKRAAYGEWVNSLNSFEDTAVTLAQDYFEGIEYLTFPEVFQKVTAAEVRDFIARWFAEEHCALSVVLPGEADE